MTRSRKRISYRRSTRRKSFRRSRKSRSLHSRPSTRYPRDRRNSIRRRFRGEYEDDLRAAIEESLRIMSDPPLENVDNRNSGHIVPRIQNLILYYPSVKDESLGMSASFLIAQRFSEIAIEEKYIHMSETQSSVWCPLIWRALEYANMIRPSDYSKLDTKRHVTEQLEDSLHKHATKLSIVQGWPNYAMKILQTEGIPKFRNDFENEFIQNLAEDFAKQSSSSK